MKRLIYLTATFTLLILLQSCATKVPFTNDTRKNYSINNEQLKSIQFYTSADIVLYRQDNKSQAGTSKGEVIVANENEREQIIIKANTPGVVIEAVGQNRLAVSFEDGDDKVLLFGTQEINGKYHLQAEEWTNRQGKLTYAGKNYLVATGSGRAYLMFKLKKLNNYKTENRKAKGRKI